MTVSVGPSRSTRRTPPVVRSSRARMAPPTAERIGARGAFASAVGPRNSDSAVHVRTQSPWASTSHADDAIRGHSRAAKARITSVWRRDVAIGIARHIYRRSGRGPAGVASDAPQVPRLRAQEGGDPVV